MKRKFNFFEPRKHPADIKVRRAFERLDVSKFDNKIIFLRANAGGGKTHSVINFLNKHNDMNILCISYTKSATDEMEKRLTKRCSNIHFRTFDSLAYANMKVLVRGLRYDSHDSKNISSDTYYSHFIKKFDPNKTTLLEYIRERKPFVNFKLARHLISEEYALKSYEVIIVDEAQDLDQYAITFLEKYMDGNKAKIFVGDPKQAIYQSRHIFEKPADMIFDFVHTFRYDGELVDFINMRMSDKHTSFGHKNTVHRKEKFELFSKRHHSFQILVSQWKDLADFDLTDILVDIKGKNHIKMYRRNHERYKKVLKEYYESTDYRDTDVKDYFESVDKLYLLDYGINRFTNVTFGTKKRDTERFITTIHRAKGLEFDNVFLHRNCVPSERSHGTIRNLENLYYVALTRAKKNISCPVVYFPYEFTQWVKKNHIYKYRTHPKYNKLLKMYLSLHGYEYYECFY